MLTKPADDWAYQIPDDEWQAYRPALHKAIARELPFALGGGLAFSYYSGMWRFTKDFDLYILPEDRDRAIKLVNDEGWSDLHDTESYDRNWIYRSAKQGLIIDLIWATANQHIPVDKEWLQGPLTNVRDLPMHIVPPEELIFAKLYVFQRHRCDWPDLLNILHAQVDQIHWMRLLTRIGDDSALLGALISVFGWLCPDKAASVPDWLYEKLGIKRPTSGQPCDEDAHRANLLESRPWFAPIERHRTSTLDKI